MEKPWKVVVAFLAVFVAGAVFGGVFTMGVARRQQSAVARVAPKATEVVPQASAANVPKGRPVPNPTKIAQAALAGLPPGSLTPRILAEFTRKLELNADQRERVRPAIARATEDLLRLRQENLADSARVTERMYEDVAAVLTPEQRTELDKMRVQMQERVRKEGLKRAAERAAERGIEAPNRPAGENAPVRPKAQKQGAQ